MKACKHGYHNEDFLYIPTFGSRYLNKVITLLIFRHNSRLRGVSPDNLVLPVDLQFTENGFLNLDFMPVEMISHLNFICKARIQPFIVFKYVQPASSCILLKTLVRS